jgi:uncharacterized protein (TIGR00369 family)
VTDVGEREDDRPTLLGREVGGYFRFQRRELPGSREGAPPAFEGWVPIDDHLRGAGGGLETAGLLTCIDSLGGLLSGLAVLPRWIVTTSLAARVVRTRQVGPLRFQARALRRGRNSVVVSVDVVDEGADDAPVATSVITCAVLDAGEMGLEFTRPLLIPMPPVDPDPVPFEEFFALESEPGQPTRLRLDDRLRNPWGILHGGAVAVLVDAAARRAAGPAGEPSAAVGAVIHYLAPVRVGPAEARTTVMGRRPDGTVVRVAVHDVGNGDRLCVLASLTVAKV